MITGMTDPVWTTSVVNDRCDCANRVQWTRDDANTKFRSDRGSTRSDRSSHGDGRRSPIRLGQPGNGARQDIAGVPLPRAGSGRP